MDNNISQRKRAHFSRVKDIDVTCIDFEGVKTAFSDPFY